MGLEWSDRKCKGDAMIVAKATITPDIKDDVWLLWGLAKKQPKLKEQIKADNFTLSKDTFDGHRWKIVWFHTVTDETYEEVEDEDTGATILKWEQDRNNLVHKWITKLAAIKDSIAGSDDEKDNSVEDPYDGTKVDEDEEPVPKKKAPVKKPAPKKVVSDEEEVKISVPKKKPIKKPAPKVVSDDEEVPSKPIAKKVIKKPVKTVQFEDDE